MQLKSLSKALNKFGKYVIQQSRSNLTKGKKNVDKKLYNSLQYKITKNPWSIEFSMEDYGEFQDKGVRGANAYYADAATSGSPYSFKSSSKIPPVKPLANWAKRRNIRLRDEKGRFTRGNYNTIGFLIARSIRDKGLKASLFFTKPFEKGFQRLGEDLRDGFINDIQSEI